MKLTIYYRISDSPSPTKIKLNHATKEHCLENCIKEFLEPARAFNIIADNVNDATWDLINGLSRKHDKIHMERLSGFGGKKSLFHAIERSLTELETGSQVYFLEDDYLHRPDACKILMEGLTIADYVTLYDHPDKYVNATEPEGNVEVRGGGEDTKVILTPSSHWKFTNSTTMTFAVTTGTLLKDKKIWHDFLLKREVPMYDYEVFACLRKKSGRTIASPIPGYSTHCEIKFLTPLINWNEI